MHRTSVLPPLCWPHKDSVLPDLDFRFLLPTRSPRSSFSSVCDLDFLLGVECPAQVLAQDLVRIFPLSPVPARTGVRGRGALSVFHSRRSALPVPSSQSCYHSPQQASDRVFVPLARFCSILGALFFPSARWFIAAPIQAVSLSRQQSSAKEPGPALPVARSSGFAFSCFGSDFACAVMLAGDSWYCFWVTG
jgi:hypothetical protein